MKFGHRLKSKQEIALACGFPQTPAPGGNCRVPSFVHEAKVQRKGVRFGNRTLSWKEIERKLGIPEPPAPGGECGAVFDAAPVHCAWHHVVCFCVPSQATVGCRRSCETT